MSQAQVTAVIPTYNRKDKIEAAIKNVLDQKRDDIEIIVVDDGSTDGTEEFLEKKNFPIKYIKKENGGVSSARNCGIKEASGKFIAFLDSDDLWLDDKVTEQVEYFENNSNVCLVYTDQYIEIDGKNIGVTRFERNKPNNRVALPAFVDYTPIHTSTVMVKKEALDAVGGFDESLSVHEDSELWNRLSDYAEFGYVEEVLGTYRWESAGEHITSAHNRNKFLENGRRYIDLYVQNKNRELTEEEKKAVEDSLKIISDLEEEQKKKDE